MRAEETLLVTVRALAGERARLDRAERRAMVEFNAAHKRFFPHDSKTLDEVIDAEIPLDHGFGIDLEETSSPEETPVAADKPTSDIFGKIKSWLGA
ncbi:hypothetical protein QM012_009361 [Aureobasidium pullulans]|uniref:Uncharacterized protein n=1 Tax=Aureobasidium pullulans TaxID=5580 RepID=A0ABR0TI48_AURPU